ncbi:ankyrin 1 [Fusarium beomiforme]|uniref:Ankyrin 1 n=1 Tax=Fusarium beomiforme TaxID=44412 RepID=A0A9P5B0P2_9HYPO|nr:ankyrin 1 [Fusarium beomiforme]
MNNTENNHCNNNGEDLGFSEADAQLEETSVSIGLNISAGKNIELHTRNDPSAPFQRSTISDRQGIIQVKCFPREIIHGYLSPDEGSATLLVYDLHLDTTKKSRRIREARVNFEFKSSVRGLGPEVAKIAPFRRITLLPTSAEASKTHGYGISAGVNQFVNVESSAKWEKTVGQTNIDSARVTGHILSDDYGRGVGAEWNLSENRLIDSGTPSFMRFAILLNRGELDENFECKVTIKVKGDWKTSAGELTGFTPRDAPILFNPTFPPTNKLRKDYDIENLGSLDLDEFVEIEFDRILESNIEGALASVQQASSSERQGSLLGNFVSFLRNTKNSAMSDSGSDSGSSLADPIPSRHASMRLEETNEVERTNNTEKKDNEMERVNKRNQDATSDVDSDSASAATKDTENDILHLEWQHEPQDQSSDLDIRLIDFVVIPGVYACRKTTRLGESPGSGSSAWVTKFAKEGYDKLSSPKAPEDSCRVLRFDYESSELFSGHRAREAIHSIALRLLNGLKSKRRGEEKKRLIYFISHDIGGAIVKDALITASLDRDSWQDISEMTRVLTRLASFLYENWNQDFGKPRPSTISISGLAKAVAQVNGLFITSHIALRSWIINVHSYGDKRNGSFDSYCATLGIPLEKRLLAPTDADYSSVAAYLAKLEPGVREPRDQTVEPRQYIQERKLLALASPIYPFRNEVKPNPLTDLPDYQTWLKCEPPQILYIHGSHRARDVAESVFYALEDEVRKVTRCANILYFSFDRWDVRADSIRDMIATFLAQICNHHPKLGPDINRFCSQIDNERGWTETDLIQFFEMFRTSPEVEQTIIVINHFDECSQSSRKRFLDHVIQKCYNSEKPWKIVVTSHEPGALSEELSGPFCVPIDISTGSLRDLRQDSLESDIQGLLSSRRDLCFRGQEIHYELSFIQRFVAPVRHLICEQLRVRKEWPDDISTNEVLGSLNLDQQGKEDDKTMASVLNWVLKKSSDEASVEHLFCWILYAVRPLTIWELATVVSFADERECHKISPSFMAVDRLVQKVEKEFAGILEVDHNEVKFKHLCLHEIMVNGDPSSQTEEEKGYLWNKIKGTAHTLIQRMCLEYLSREAVQEYVKKTFAVPDSATFETPLFPDRTNLASYAIQAWTHHYSLCSPLPDLSAISSKKDSAQILARAQWCLANPATKRSPCFQSFFPIFAGLGLPNVVVPLGSDDALRGLIEAARRGQKQVVEEILGEYDFTPAEKWDVLQAASSSGNEDLMNNLLDKIEAKSEIPKDFEWPPVLIYRAANLGLEGFAERILSLGCSPDPGVEWRNSTSIHASPLYLAACHGYTATVRVLLKHGDSLELTTDSWRNPLHKAALEGHAETVKAILEESQINIDYVSDSKFTALYLSVIGGNHTTVKLLLEKGADPNMGIPDIYTGDDQWTPLVAATDDGFKKCIRLLLDNGANPNLSGPSGPPLHWAVMRGRVDIVDMLLEAGANPRSELLKTPLLATAVGAGLKEGGLSIFERVLELNLDVNAQDNQGNTALDFAILSLDDDENDEISDHDRERHRAFKILLDRGANPNSNADDRWTPLQRAIEKKQYQMVEMLLQAGADPNATSLKNRQPPLHSALRQPKIVRLLLRSGADPNIRSSFGFTALTFAACFNHEEAVEALLEYEVAVDLEYGIGVEDPLDAWLVGWTPVMCAAQFGYDGILRLLAEAGADLQRKCPWDNKPILHLALQGKVTSTILEFPSRIDINATDGDNVGALHIRDLSLQDLKRLVNAGADIELEGPRERTPLHVYSDCNFENAMFLIKRGANVNHILPSLGSPLHQACRGCQPDTIRLLVEHGADITVADESLGTPLQALCIPGKSIDPVEHEKIIRYLISEHEKQKADLTLKAGLFGYAINAAAFGSSPAIINLILEETGASLDVRDDMGRMPIHLAACNGMPNFEVVLLRGGDMYAKDKQGRTPLHWAAQTGRLGVVEKIISLMEDMTAINAPDIDGWSPLCWALRGGLTLQNENNAGEPSRCTDVIRLLLEKGASRNPFEKGEEVWNPLTIAYYHQGTPDTISLLTNENGQNNDSTTENNEEKSGRNKRVKKGVERAGVSCDYCYSKIYGFHWSCTVCKNFCFCFKCHIHADILHPEHQGFVREGEEEYEGGEETSGASTSGSSNTYSNSDSDTDSDESGDEEGGKEEGEEEKETENT